MRAAFGISPNTPFTCHLVRGSDIRVRALMPTPSPHPEFVNRESVNPESGLRHQLTAGQMTMVAVGGSIGTGLLLGTAAAIELAGPAVIPSFVLAAFIRCARPHPLRETTSTLPAARFF